MKIISHVLIAFSFMFVVSCSDAEKNNEDTATEEVQMNTSTDQLSEPAMNQQYQNQLNDTANVALNPPHGEPGHDCAIPVGAPLGSSPQTNTQVAEGTNPPHGQPGHDCSIPVGAPLNQE